MKYYFKVALDHFAFGLIIPISIAWKLANGLSLAEAAGTEALILITTSILEIPAGVFADRFGNKKSLLLGGVLHLLALVALAFGGDLWVFALAACLSGAAWAFISGADEAYVHDDYIEDKKNYKRVFANASIADEVATIAGMLVSSVLLYVNADTRMLFVLAAGVTASSIVYFWVQLPASKPLRQAHEHPGLFSLNFFRNISLKGVMSLAPLFLAFAILYESGRLLWQPQLANLGIDIANFGFAFAGFKLASIAGSFAARSHSFTRVQVTLLFIAMSVALTLFGVPIAIVSIVALTMFLFTENYFRVYMSYTLNKLISKNRATTLSMSSLTTNTVGGLVVVSLGAVAQSYTILAALTLLVALKVPAMVYLVARQKK